MSPDAAVATVAGTPVPVAEVDAREAALRGAPQVSALPRPHTSEGRQLRRWLTQLLVTERVIAREAAALGVTVTATTPTQDEVLPDLTARLEIGSIAASVLTDPLARAVFDHITRDVDVDGADAFAPPIGPEWEAVATGEHHTSRTGIGYRFVDYRRHTTADALS